MDDEVPMDPTSCFTGKKWKNRPRPARRRGSRLSLRLVAPLILAALCGPAVDLHAGSMHAAPPARPNPPGLRLPPAPLPDIETFMQIGAAGSPALSRDGRRLFFLSRASGTAQIYRLLPAGWPYQLTFVSEGVDFSVFNAEATFAILGIDAGGDENHQLYLLDAETGEIRPLTDRPKVRHTSPSWSRDGQRIFYGSNANDPASFFLYEMTLRDGRARLILRKSGVNTVNDESEDGSSIIYSNASSSLDNNLYVYNLRTGQERLLTPHTGEHSYWGAAFAAGGRSIYLVTDDTPSGRSRLIRLDLATLRREPLFRDDTPWELESFDLSDNRRFLAYVMNEDGYGRLRLHDLRDDRPLPVPELNGIAASPDVADGGYLAYVFNSPTRTADVWIWRFAAPGGPMDAGDDGARRAGGEAPRWGRRSGTPGASTEGADIAGRRPDPTPGGLNAGGLNTGGRNTGDLSTSPVRFEATPFWMAAGSGPVQATFSSYAGVDPGIFHEPELVRYRSFDGREIPAFLYLPPGEYQGPIPFIIEAHGGPTGQFRPFFNRHFQYLMQHGFGILAPNVRGSTGYGREYEDADNYRKRLDSVRDFAEGARWLIARGYSEQGRIGIKGASYGGYMTLAAMTEFPDLFAAGVDQVGIADFGSFLERTADYRRTLRESEYGPMSDREFLRSISPLYKADRIRGALMVVHGENDPRVPVHEARQILRALRERGVPADSLIFPDEGHGVAKRPNQLLFYRRMVEFFERHLGGGTVARESGG